MKIWYERENAMTMIQKDGPHNMMVRVGWWVDDNGGGWRWGRKPSTTTTKTPTCHLFSLSYHTNPIC